MVSMSSVILASGSGRSEADAFIMAWAFCSAVERYVVVNNMAGMANGGEDLAGSVDGAVGGHGSGLQTSSSAIIPTVDSGLPLSGSGLVPSSGSGMNGSMEAVSGGLPACISGAEGGAGPSSEGLVFAPILSSSFSHLPPMASAPPSAGFSGVGAGSFNDTTLPPASGVNPVFTSTPNPDVKGVSNVGATSGFSFLSASGVNPAVTSTSSLGIRSISDVGATSGVSVTSDGGLAPCLNPAEQELGMWPVKKANSVSSSESDSVYLIKGRFVKMSSSSGELGCEHESSSELGSLLSKSVSSVW